MNKEKDYNNKELGKRCAICTHYDLWFGACFAKEEGIGNPLEHNFRNSNFNNRDGVCDLFE